ncbi:unnamed protein product [Oikopleura dioica]|uniref:Uncharacterized protein n=1 Tax=Oikopleura dioica TaxID=34765 RepID=E4WRZ7_OIKDI|nr:unnamed protein product [Oikopleura dioica]
MFRGIYSERFSTNTKGSNIKNASHKKTEIRLIYVKSECFGNNDDKCGCARQTNWSLFMVSAAVSVCYFFIIVITAASVNTFNSNTAFWGFMGFLIYGFAVSASLAGVMHNSDERNQIENNLNAFWDDGENQIHPAPVVDPVIPFNENQQELPQQNDYWNIPRPEDLRFRDENRHEIPERPPGQAENNRNERNEAVDCTICYELYDNENHFMVMARCGHKANTCKSSLPSMPSSGVCRPASKSLHVTTLRYLST